MRSAANFIEARKTSTTYAHLGTTYMASFALIHRPISSLALTDQCHGSRRIFRAAARAPVTVSLALGRSAPRSVEPAYRRTQSICGVSAALSAPDTAPLSFTSVPGQLQTNQDTDHQTPCAFRAHQVDGRRNENRCSASWSRYADGSGFISSMFKH